MAAPLLKISTTVRKTMTLGALRLYFRLGGLLWPHAALERAARLFCTPYPGSRRRALSAPAAGGREDRLDVDGTRLAIYVWGDPATQPYVLFAHGWSSHGTRIARWVGPLQAAGFAIVAFDQAAHGRSDGRRTTLPDFARHLLAVGRRLGPAAAVVGHSLGGAATAIALANGLQATRAVLIAPPADPLAAVDQFARAVGLARHLAGRMFAMFEQRTGVTARDMQAQFVAPRIALPALILHDLEDREVPWSEGERYARYWPQARLVSTRGLGHNRIVDDAGTIGAVLRFLRGEPVGERVVSSPNLPYGWA